MTTSDTSRDGDRAILELAARAAGIKALREFTLPDGTSSGESAFGLWNRDDGGLWNPLRDDGDALRLAAAARLEVMVTDVGAVVKLHGRAGILIAEWSDSPQNGNHGAAIRRAIVRCVAENEQERASIATSARSETMGAE